MSPPLSNWRSGLRALRRPDFRHRLKQVVETIVTAGENETEVRSAIRKGVSVEQWRRFLRILLDMLHPYDAISVLSEARLTRALEGMDERLFIHTEAKTSNMRIQAASKEPWTYAWIQNVLRAGDVFYDVGANVGSYSLLALSRGLEVIAFEPHYENFRELCRNVDLNKLCARAALVPLALSDQIGATRNPILAPSAGETMSLGAGERGSVVILTSTLDDARRNLQLPDPNHIKIDVDGWEVRVLEGASETFAMEQLRTCLIEIDGRAQGPDADRNNAVWSFLNARGFGIYAIAYPMAQDVSYLLGIRGDITAVKNSLAQRGINLVVPAGH